EQLRTAGFEVEVVSPSTGLANFMLSLDRYDAAIFFRVPAFPDVIDAIVSASDRGLATFYEIDDIVFDEAHFPPAFENYANQISRLDYDAMACGVPLFGHAMELCDYGIASTATLRNLMESRVRSGKVFEHHNALGSLHLSAIRAAASQQAADRKDRPLVLFYGSGTKAHKEDFHDILEPALAAVVRKFPGKVEVRLIGSFDRFKHFDMARDPVQLMEPVWDFEEYCSVLAQADINLSVLSPSLLTDAKSEIKWMEAAMFGIPSVVSATATHLETIDDGRTGLLCSSVVDFTQALISLIENPDRRAEIGSAAREVVMERYSLEAMGQNMAQIFEEIRPANGKKTRLMIVNVFYPPQAIGGATRVVHDNVKLLRQHYGDQFEIDVVCTIEGGTTPYEVSQFSQDGVRVWGITTPDEPDIDAKARDPKMAKVFDALMDRIRPDLIHFHCIQRLTASIVDAARLKNIPYVITMHDAWWISPNQFVLDSEGKSAFYDYTPEGKQMLPERARDLSRPLLGAARLLPVSEPFCELHRKTGLPNLQTIENGVSDLPSTLRTTSPTGRVRLAHIGGASRHKGYHLVQNALYANSYENLELLVIDHALPPGVVQTELWGTTPVTLTGKVPQAEVASLYARIDVLLAPSTWPESYGLVTREALAAGCWVIASDRGAIGQDVVEGENGYVVQADTFEGVAEALRTVDRGPERFLVAPLVRIDIRRALDQATELVSLYRDVLVNE
ncbi:glycosyltransferase, partial [Thioclava sp. BHET1]